MLPVQDLSMLKLSLFRAEVDQLCEALDISDQTTLDKVEKVVTRLEQQMQLVLFALTSLSEQYQLEAHEFGSDLVARFARDWRNTSAAPFDVDLFHDAIRQALSAATPALILQARDKVKQEFELFDKQAAYIVQQLLNRIAQQEPIPRRKPPSDADAELPAYKKIESIAELHAEPTLTQTLAKVFARVDDAMIDAYMKRQEAKITFMKNSQGIKMIKEQLAQEVRLLKEDQALDPNNLARLQTIARLRAQKAQLLAVFEKPEDKDIKTALQYLALFNMPSMRQLKALNAQQIEKYIVDYHNSFMPLREDQKEHLQTEILAVIPAVAYMAAKITTDAFTYLSYPKFIVDEYLREYMDSAHTFYEDAPLGAIDPNLGIFTDIDAGINEHNLAVLEKFLQRAFPGSIILTDPEKLVSASERHDLDSLIQDLTAAVTFEQKKEAMLFRPAPIIPVTPSSPSTTTGSVSGDESPLPSPPPRPGAPGPGGSSFNA